MNTKRTLALAALATFLVADFADAQGVSPGRNSSSSRFGARYLLAITAEAALGPAWEEAVVLGLEAADPVAAAAVAPKAECRKSISPRSSGPKSRFPKSRFQIYDQSHLLAVVDRCSRK